MSLIAWSESMSVKVQEIDLQHQQLINLINELNDAMHRGDGQGGLGNLIAGLADYAVMHFATEEKYFRQFGYADSVAHIAEHRKFVDDVSRFKQGFDEGRRGVSVDVLRFLSDWLRKHILGSDMNYAAFMASKGLK
jgi:hemerythrin